MNWFLVALKKYAVFNGRSCRSEFWFFTLFQILIIVGLMILFTVIGLAPEISGMAVMVASLALLLPSIAVGVRRLHDIDKSGWWMLLMIVPIVSLLLIIFFVKKGTDGPNRFGEDPLA